MTYAELADYVCDKVRHQDAKVVAIAKKMVNRRYEMIWNGHLWKDLLRQQAFTVNAGDEELTLTEEVDRVVAVRWGERHTLLPVEQATLFRYDPASFERSGNPLEFYELPADAPAGAIKIRFISIPKETKQALVLFKKRFVPLEADDDVPLLRGIDNALIAAAMSDMLERERQYAKAAAKMQESAAMVGQMVQQETAQGASAIVLMPVPDGFIYGGSGLSRNDAFLRGP